MTLEGPRLMDKTLTAITIGITTEAPYASGRVGDWELIEAVGPSGTFANRSYFDLSGYTLEDLTAFMNAVDVQEGFPTHGNMSAVWITDLLTTEFIDDAAIIAGVANHSGEMPGFPGSVYNMSQVVYGRTRVFGSQTIASVPIMSLYPKEEVRWGTGGAWLHRKCILLESSITPGSLRNL